jgi:hypothetical protein
MGLNKARAASRQAAGSCQRIRNAPDPLPAIRRRLPAAS